MWTRKTEDEIKKEKDNFKLSYNAPILIFIMVFIVYFGHYVTGARYSRMTPKSISILEFMKLLPEILLVGLILSVVVLLLQMLLKKNFLDKNDNITTVICDKCNDKKTDDANYSCKCGGTFINIKKMKWIEESE